MELQRHQIVKRFLRKKLNGKHHTSSFKIILQSYHNLNGIIKLQNRHIDQGYRIDIPEINSNIYGQLISEKGAKRHNEERTVSSIHVLGKLDFHMQNNETGPYLTAYTKVNLK